VARRDGRRGSSAPLQTPGGSTLNRPADAAVITGRQAQELIGTAPNRVVSGQWQQIPAQVDERKDTTMAAVYGLPTSQTFYGSSINIPVNVYADPNTFTGADTNANVDADDEIAFMVRDAGAQATTTMAAPAGTTGQRVEVKLAEPEGATGSGTGYVYVFASTGSVGAVAQHRHGQPRHRRHGDAGLVAVGDDSPAGPVAVLEVEHVRRPPLDPAPHGAVGQHQLAVGPHQVILELEDAHGPVLQRQAPADHGLGGRPLLGPASSS
jgi:hypothetical protein